jgi:hypothetical protein
MPTQIKDFLANKELPSFITKNETLLSFNKVSKVFPRIGLPNCSETCEFHNQEIRSIADNLIREIYYGLYNLSHFSYGRGANETYWCTIAGTLGSRCLYNANEMITTNNGKIVIKLDCDIFINGKAVFKKDESLFRVYNKIYTEVSELKCGICIEKLESMPSFKEFSSENIPNKKFQIVFSSDGVDGLWDIATMSMRGIKSCQSWDGQYKKKLIGSIVDPFVGIIYLTSGTNINGLGSKMIRRSIVRLVAHSETKKPIIIVDRIYPNDDDIVRNQFISFIKKKVGDKFDVIFGPHDATNLTETTYIPLSPVHKKLPISIRSYRDLKVPFKIELPNLSTHDKNIGNKRTSFRNILRNTSFEHCDKINLSGVGINKTSDFSYLLRDYYRNVANNVIKNGPQANEFDTSSNYMKNLCYYYIANKNAAIKATKPAFVKKINAYYKKKINSKQLFTALQPIQKEIDNKIKIALKKLISKKTPTINLPN